MMAFKLRQQKNSQRKQKSAGTHTHTRALTLKTTHTEFMLPTNEALITQKKRKRKSEAAEFQMLQWITRNIFSLLLTGCWCAVQTPTPRSRFHPRPPHSSVGGECGQVGRMMRVVAAWRAGRDPQWHSARRKHTGRGWAEGGVSTGQSGIESHDWLRPQQASWAKGQKKKNSERM